MGTIDNSFVARKRVAFVTIGQSPREDIVPDLLEQITVEVDAVEFGALDGVDEDAIRALAPISEDSILYTRLRSGADVIIRKEWIADRLNQLFAEIDSAGFDLIVLLCTAEFPNLQSRTAMIDAVVDIDPLLVDGRRLGVVLPTPGQVEELSLNRYGHGTAFAHYAPHAPGDRDDELDLAAVGLAGTQQVIMDCMAFDNDDRTRLQSKIAAPVVLARDLLGEKINITVSKI